MGTFSWKSVDIASAELLINSVPKKHFWVWEDAIVPSEKGLLRTLDGLTDSGVGPDGIAYSGYQACKQ
eukprot:1852122-Karenia_brevis.AAC.1